MIFRFYWDVFWGFNMVMHLFLLGVTAVCRRKRFSFRRMCFAAFAGSGGMTLLTVGWLHCSFAKNAGLAAKPQGGQIVVYAGISLVVVLGMLQLTFVETKRKELGRDFLCFMQGTLLTGGLLSAVREWIGQKESVHGWVILAGALGVFMMFWVLERVLQQTEKQKHTMDGTIVSENGRSVTLRVLEDTGNQLISPYSGERVMVLAQDAAESLALAGNQMPLWIPFQSVGGAGVLPAYRISRLILQDGTEIKNFLAAVSPRLSEASAVQLIMYGRG